MKINIKYFAIFNILIFGVQYYSYGWITTLKVMQHADGHIVRLAGDVHLESFTLDKNFLKAIEQEEKFLIYVEEPLTNFLNMDLDKIECFVVEKIIYDLLPISNSLQTILSQGTIASVPLITRLNIIAHPKISSSVKAKIACINKFKLQPKIEIISYDVRSLYHNLCTMSFPSTQQEYEMFCMELLSNQQLFKIDVQKLIDIKNNYPSKFVDFIEKKGNSLIEKIDDVLQLENFFIYEFTDFGYITFIAQNSCKNITLFLGIIHCHNIAQYLEKIGYKTILEKGFYDEKKSGLNIIPCCCSMKDYQDFFTMGRK